MSLPLELVSDIINAVLEVNRDYRKGKGDWVSVSPLSLTCRSYRTLVLKAWFREFYPVSLEDTLKLSHHIPQAQRGWVRRINCNISDDKFPWDLEGYEQLEYIRLSWVAISEPSPRGCPFVNVPATVKTFEFRDFNPLLATSYQFISECLPSINRLILDQRKVFCHLCGWSVAVKFQDPRSESLTYKGGLGLPFHYARAFQSLNFLEHITLNTTVFQGDNIYFPRLRDYMWIGECDRHIRRPYGDPESVGSYVQAKKQGIFKPWRDGDETWPQPPALKIVEWIFRPATDAEEDALWDEDVEIEYD